MWNVRGLLGGLRGLGSGNIGGAVGGAVGGLAAGGVAWQRPPAPGYIGPTQWAAYQRQAMSNVPGTITFKWITGPGPTDEERTAHDLGGCLAALAARGVGLKPERSVVMRCPACQTEVLVGGEP